MPSSMTHNYFALDVYNRLDNKAKKKIKHKLEYFKTFAQGPDCYYFYNFTIGKKSKEINNIGKIMHKSKTRDHFINLITYINDNNLFNNAQVMSYLYGNICHYILDSTAHPFVFYNTGVYNKNNKASYKYNALHAEMEYFIDIYMIFQNEKVEANKFRAYKHLGNIEEFDPKLNKLIDTVTKDTYNIEGASYCYYKSIKHMKRFFRLFHYDRLGIKKLGYKIIDKVCPPSCVRKEPLSFNVYHNKKIHYLNLEKNEWNHPMFQEEIYDYSFIELYVIAINKALKIINEVNNMLENKNLNKKNLEGLFGNLSYASGKDCECREKLQYFRF